MRPRLIAHSGGCAFAQSATTTPATPIKPGPAAALATIRCFARQTPPYGFEDQKR
jgi:hypothetical protein